MIGVNLSTLFIPFAVADAVRWTHAEEYSKDAEDGTNACVDKIIFVSTVNDLQRFFEVHSRESSPKALK